MEEKMENMGCSTLNVKQRSLDFICGSCAFAQKNDLIKVEVALERVTDKTVRVCVLQKFSFKIQNISTVAVGTDEKGVSVRN